MNNHFDSIRDQTRPVVVAVQLDNTQALSLEHILSVEENQRSQHFRFLEDRNSYVAAHALKRLLLQRASSLPAPKLHFQTNEFGKPFLPGSDISFSLSHTRGLAAVALSWCGPIGVDAETCSFELSADLLNLGILSAAEIDLISRADNPSLAFLHRWTAKEAVSKAVGMGLSMSFAEIMIDETSARTAGKSWNLQFEYPTTAHILAVATTGTDAGISFRCFDNRDIWQHLQVDSAGSTGRARAT